MIDINTHTNKERFEEALKKVSFRFPVAEISSKTGYGKSQVSKILNGSISISDDFLNKFLKSFNIDLHNKEVLTEKNYKPKSIINKNEGVPYYDVDFTASFLVLENNNQTTPDSYISHPFFKGCDYVVRASGQSMAKVISHGDAIGLIKVDNWVDFFPFGEIYAIVTKDNFRMIKVITKGDNDETFTLISKPTDSKKDEFPPQQIKKSSILYIFKVQASSHLF
ncbi:S24 family peptidase [Flavobacterium sp. SUN046]|uniref:LexA family transcriptional regulator n=1 Tax=Flavobacterium sp. SUN046 TaxID=3002440 RepID=UPI002DB751E1|nr:S24 family peptidase [Flavobacterium sp. SUN046]MEC4049779.1 S24 family peptidase [Flavobacterium sp. SUN046]